MPNVAEALKAEIARVARKEVRAETTQMKKASSAYRQQISSLRKKIDDLERQLKRTTKSQAKTESQPEDSEEGTKQLRFSAARFASTRHKLGLSAAQMGTLLGVSGQSVYKWEKGEARPRRSQLEAIAKVRGLGKREAAARLESLAAMG